MKGIGLKLSNISEKAFLVIFLGSLFIYKAIIGLQGFDMCDEGYVLSAYQQIFNDPTSCEGNFLMYNALLVGGVWNLLFASLGIYGFRLLSVFCFVLTAYIVYLLLRKDINRWCIFIGIMLFNLEYFLVFHHNYLTALFTVLAALFLYKGLTLSNKLWTILAGFVVGINVFTRIANVSMFALSLVFIPYCYYIKDVRKTLQLLLMAVIGVIVGIGCEILLMYSLGHLSIFIESLSSGFITVSASDSTHKLSRLFGIYISNYRFIYYQLMVLLGVPMLVYFANKLLMEKRNRDRKFLLWIAAVVYFIVIWKNERSSYIIYAISLLVFFIYVLRHPQEKNSVYLISIATIILFFLPFGSDFGIGNMGSNCIWISTPLTIGLLYKLLQKKHTQNYKNARAFLYIFIVAFVAHSLYKTSLYCCFDSGSRFKKTSRPQTALATTYTTAFKAGQIDTLMMHLQPIVKKNDFLLCYQSVPMLNYLTETRPYLGCSWPWCYVSDVLEYHFIKSQNTISTLPVIVRNKSKIAKWHLYAEDWDNAFSKDQYEFNFHKIKLIHQFIQNNNYIVYWENDLFQILLPPTKFNEEKIE